MIRIFSIWVAGNVLVLLISEIALLFGCYVAAAYLPSPLDAELYLFYDGGLLHIAIVVATVVLGLHFHDLYDDPRPSSMLLLVQQLCLTLGAAFFLQAIFAYGRLDVQLPRSLMLYGSAIALAAVPLWRQLYWFLVQKSVPIRRIMFLGTSPTALEVMSRISQRPDLGSAVIGYLDSDERSPEQVGQFPFLGGLGDLRSVIDSRHPNRIIIGAAETELPPPGELLALRFAGVQVEEAAAVYESLLGRVSTRDLRPAQVVFWAGPQPINARLHNAYSFVLALACLAVVWPVMIVVAVLVKLTSPGPALFRQQRVGLNGKPFELLKFRSMGVNAEAKTGAVWAQRDDPRVTPLGRWLRRLRLDELPQLFNVVGGEMSLIGPRPERPEFVRTLAEQIPFYEQRHCIKPGITGWAQINHKYGDTIADAKIKLEFDLYYIKHLTPAFDALIVFHTLKVMLLQRGAR